MSNIILLSGWKRSGKDTVAEYLVAEYGYEQLSIAAPLKDMVARKYRIPRSWLDDQDKKELPLANMPILAADSNSLKIHEIFSDSYYRDTVNIREDGGAQLYWTPRALLILEGSVARAVNPHHWTDQIVKGIQDNPGNYVVSDVRFRSEVGHIQRELGRENIQVIRINRHSTNTSTDASEVDLDKFSFDTIYENAGSLEDLYDMIDFDMAVRG